MIKLDIILTATSKEEMAFVADAINKQIDALYQKLPEMIVDLKPSQTNTDNSITESLTLIINSNK